MKCQPKASIPRRSCCTPASAAIPATNAVAVPIYQTTSYQFDDTEHAARPVRPAGAGQHLHPHHEPDRRVLEERVAALEGGVAALALASGQAASLFAVQNIAHAGDNIVASTDLYGGTWNLFPNTLKDHGHRGALRRSGRSRGVPPRHRRAARAAITPRRCRTRS